MKKVAIFIAIAIAVASLGIVAINAEEFTTTTTNDVVETTSFVPRFGGMMGGFGMMGGYYNTTSGTNTYPYYGGMMGGYGYDATVGCRNANGVDVTSYEFLYAHLSETDQAIVDAKYLELLLIVDFDVLTTEEQLASINTIKTQLVEFIQTEGFVTTYYRP